MLKLFQRVLVIIMIICLLLSPQVKANVDNNLTVNKFTCILSGLNHTVALKKDGTVWCWGSNAYGQLGNNSKRNSSIPVQAKGLTSIVSLAVGPYHTVALKKDGTVWSWGLNHCGQLGFSPPKNENQKNKIGEGKGEKVLIPTKIKVVGKAIKVSAGGFYYSSNLASFTQVTFENGATVTWGDTSLFRSPYLVLNKDKENTYINEDKTILAFVSGGVVYVPIEAVSEKLGAKLEWNNSENAVRVKKGFKLLEFAVGVNKVIIYGDGEKPIQGTPILREGILFVPIEPLVENLPCEYGKAYEVYWDKEKDTITIMKTFFGI